MKHLIDESPIGAWLGAIYTCACLLGWIPIDRWLHRHHHEYITTEVRELLEGGTWKAILFVFLVGGILGIAFFHFFYERQI